MDRRVVIEYETGKAWDDEGVPDPEEKGRAPGWYAHASAQAERNGWNCYRSLDRAGPFATAEEALAHALAALNEEPAV